MGTDASSKACCIFQTLLAKYSTSINGLKTGFVCSAYLPSTVEANVNLKIFCLAAI